MARFRYKEYDCVASWEECFYHGCVQVVEGYAETDDPLTMEALLFHHFELVDEDAPVQAGE